MEPQTFWYNYCLQLQSFKKKFKTRHNILNKIDKTDFYGLHTKLYKFISPKA